MTEKKIIEAFIHSITKPPLVQTDGIPADWPSHQVIAEPMDCLLGQRIIELRREEDKDHEPSAFWFILENGVKIKLYPISALGIEVTND